MHLSYRAAYPDHDWLHLTGLIHDLGKVLAHPAFGSQPQWAVVGDTFPVGCGHDPAVIFHAHFAANPDAADPRYSSPLGVYAPGCGLRNVTMSWGHDEYMYMVSTRVCLRVCPCVCVRACVSVCDIACLLTSMQEGACSRRGGNLPRRLPYLTIPTFVRLITGTP